MKTVYIPPRTADEDEDKDVAIAEQEERKQLQKRKNARRILEEMKDERPDTDF